MLGASLAREKKGARRKSAQCTEKSVHGRLPFLTMIGQRHTGRAAGN
jgi:hypothetical protein